MLDVTFSPSAITFTTWDDWNGKRAYLAATVTPVPTDSAYVIVEDSGEAFVPGDVIVMAAGPETFEASLPIKDVLLPGTHSGTLTVKICRDPACAQPYPLSRSTVPYDVTVLPVAQTPVVPTAVVKIDGAEVANSNEGTSGIERTYSVTMVSGHTVELEPSLPFLTRTPESNGYVPVTVSMPPPSQPGGLRATVAFTPETSAATTSVQLVGRVEGGGTVRLTVNLTR
jgi:hypothetical protein